MGQLAKTLEGLPIFSRTFLIFWDRKDSLLEPQRSVYVGNKLQHTWMPSQCISKLLINSWFFSQGLHCLFCLSLCMQVLRISEVPWGTHQILLDLELSCLQVMVTSFLPFFLPKMHWHFSSLTALIILHSFLHPYLNELLWRLPEHDVRHVYHVESIACADLDVDRIPLISRKVEIDRQSQGRRSGWEAVLSLMHSELLESSLHLLPLHFSLWTFFNPLGLASVTITPSESAFVECTKNWLPNLVYTQ